MKILVTGGAGFIGSNFVRYVLAKHKEVTVLNLDKLTYAGNPDNLKGLGGDPRHRFIKGDIEDENLVGEILRGEKPDVVINFAAETHVDRSILDPKSFLKTNVLGVENLLQQVRKFKIPRMVQVSTDEVYGSIADGEFTEKSPFEPNSPYSASKAAGDLLCHAFFKTYQVPVIVTHACNCYGPYQYPEKLMPLFITNLIEGKKVPLYGDGQQVREWIYTEDFCSAVDVVAAKGRPGEAYNIGTGHRESNLETTKKILAALGKDESFIQPVAERPGHDRRYAVNSDKLRTELGWQPSHKFDDALRQTVEWYRDNEWWWKKIKSGEYLTYYQQQYKIK